MEKSSSAGRKCARYKLVVLNVIFCVFGLAMFGVGISILTGSQTLKFLQYVKLDTTGNSLVHSSANLLIAVGIFMIITANIGCLGALTEKFCFLCMFLVFLSALILLQLVAGITAAVFHSKVTGAIETAKGFMEKTMMDEYGLPDTPDRDHIITETWDQIQIKMGCCGAERGPLLWHRTKWAELPGNKNMTVPNSCCVMVDKEDAHPKPLNEDMCQSKAHFPSSGSSSRYVHLDGCLPALSRWAVNKAVIVMCLCFGLASLEVCGLIVAYVLRQSKLQMYRRLQTSSLR